MLYKETGQYKSSYKSDHAIFPLIQDKIAFSTLMFIAFLIKFRGFTITLIPDKLLFQKD